MEKENLCEMLKGHEGKTFYSPAYGDVKLIKAISGGPIIVKTDDHQISFNSNGILLFTKGECMLFPSKDQRDWNKWIEENKSKTSKTWSDSLFTVYELSYIDNDKDYVLTSTGISPIERSALALLKIHQLIEIGYGGNITNEEWKEHTKIKYTIDLKDKKLICSYTYLFKSHIAFHTKEQAEEFLKYSENVQLLKDYFMI